MNQPRHLLVTGVAAVVALAALPTAPLAPGPPAAAAVASERQRAARPHVAGVAAIADGIRVRRGRIGVETLDGRPLRLPGRPRTGRGGGVFFVTKGLPKRFVVTVRLPEQGVRGMSGTLRAFASRQRRTQVSFGTTVAVALYRKRHGRWSPKRATVRATQALGLPAWTRLGFDDRVNKHFVHPAVLRAKSRGQLNRLAGRVANKSLHRNRIALFRGRGWTSYRFASAPRSISPQPKGAARSELAASPIQTGFQIAGVATKIYGDIDTVAQASQLDTEMQQFVGAVDAANSYLSSVENDYNLAFQDIADDIEESQYVQMRSIFDDSFAIQSSMNMLLDLQAGPSCSNPCTSAEVQAYTNAVDVVMSGFGNDSGMFITNSSETISRQILGGDSMGLWQALLVALTGLQTSGELATQGIPISGNLLTNPVSQRYVALLNNLLADLQQTYFIAANLQAATATCQVQFAVGATTPSPSPGPNGAQNVFTMQDLADVVQYAEDLIPPPVPVGTIWDGSTNDLWAGLGDRMLNDNGLTSVTSLATGVSQEMSNGAPIPAFTVDGSTWVPDPGATITPSQIQSPTFTNGTWRASWNLASLYLSSAGSPSTWASASLGDMVAGTPGLTGQFPGTNWQTVWNALTNVPLAVTQTSQGFTTGTAGSPTAVTRSVTSTDPDTGQPVSTQYWYLAGPAGQLSPGVYSSATWAYDTSYGSGLYLVVQGGGMASSVSNTWNYPAYGVPNMLVFMQYGNPEYTIQTPDPDAVPSFAPINDPSVCG